MDEVSKVREKTNVVELVSEFVPLKKTGANFKGLCPFHSEKSPSFVVSAERQIWHCFGCGKGGDAFSFLMEYEHMDFPEALKILARRAGIELQDRRFDSGQSFKKERIYQINKAASDYYHYVLTKHTAGREALSYLTQNRKLNMEIISTFSIGFAPRGGEDLVSYLINKKNYKRQDLEDAGLITRIRGRDIDFFRGRIIFPLTDNRENIVGFSARALDNSMPKYLNTKETLVYHKGSLFFGLGRAIDEIKKKDKVIIVEGEFDVISSAMEGIKNVVAIKGTALTEDQVNLISRYTANVALCLDTDNAGFEAVKRSLGVLERKGITTTVIILPGGKDADEAIKKDALGFKKAVAKDEPVYDFLLSSFLTMHDKENVLGKKKIGDLLLPFISSISNEIIKEHTIKKMSVALDTTYESLTRQIEKMQKPNLIKEKKESVGKTKRPRKEVLEEYLMSLIIQSEKGKESFEESLKILGDFEFELPSYQKIVEKLKVYFKKNDVFKAKNFGKILSPELIGTYDKWFLLEIPRFTDFDKFQEEVKSASRELKSLSLKKRMQELTDKLRNTKQGSEEEILRKELNHIIENLSNPSS